MKKTLPLNILSWLTDLYSGAGAGAGMLHERQESSEEA